MGNAKTSFLTSSYKKVVSLYLGQVTHPGRAYISHCGEKQQAVFLLLQDRKTVQCRVPSQQFLRDSWQFAHTHSYSLVESGFPRTPQHHPTRSWDWTSQPRIQHQLSGQWSPTLWNKVKHFLPSLLYSDLYFAVHLFHPEMIKMQLLPIISIHHQESRQ